MMYPILYGSSSSIIIAAYSSAFFWMADRLLVDELRLMTLIHKKTEQRTIKYYSKKMIKILTVRFLFFFHVNHLFFYLNDLYNIWHKFVF